jgi:hypothetical protein
MEEDKVCVACSAYGEKGRDHLEDLGVDGRIIFKGTIGSFVVRLRIRFIWFSVGTFSGLL